VLLVGEFPGYEELRTGRPFVGKAGEILRQEFARAGHQFEACRVTNLWLHGKVRDQDEFDWHMGNLLAEMRGREHILLMGSECTAAFNLGSVMSLAGLQVFSPFFPQEATVFVAPNPALLMHDVVGEFRLALQKFVDQISQQGDKDD
jgi:uracil-DNA glycosylase